MRDAGNFAKPSTQGATPKDRGNIVNDVLGNFISYEVKTNLAQPKADYLAGPRNSERVSLLFDDFDSLSAAKQACVRTVMDVTATSVQWIFTTTRPEKIDSGIKDRCVTVCTDVQPFGQQAEWAMEKYFDAVSVKLEKGKVSIDRESLRSIVRTFFPKFRQIAAYVQINATVDPSAIYKQKTEEAQEAAA